MKLYYSSSFVLILLAIVCGCHEKEPSASDCATKKARCAMQMLATNAAVKVIKDSYSVRTNLALVTDRKRRLALIRDWERLLMSIPVEGLSPEKRFDAIKESSDMLNSYVSAALWDAGCDFGEIWDLHFRVLSWLDRQVSLMKPEVSSNNDLSRRELLTKWNFYQALAEWRETIVENHERFDLDERMKMPGMERINEVRKRFEMMIGRPVRSCTEIKMLGHYHKLVRKRIEAEKNAALTSARDREILSKQGEARQ